jgi:two-component system, sensor histidine kinase and response regulator
LASIADLDAEAGLRLLHGRLSSYRRVLKLFADGHAGDVAQLAKLIEQGDLVAAQKLAHALKGAAGNVGARAIHSLAATLDTALKQGDRPAAEAALIPLAEHLPEVIANLQAALAEAPRAVVVAVAELSAEQRRMIHDLLDLLGAGNSRARHLLAARRTEFESALGSERYAQLEDSTQRFDYPAALRLLEDFS